MLRFTVNMASCCAVCGTVGSLELLHATANCVDVRLMGLSYTSPVTSLREYTSVVKPSPLRMICVLERS